MYKANISWIPLCEILNTLLDRDFIRVEIDGKTKRYFLTEKGERALSYHLKSMEAFMKPVVIRNHPVPNPIQVS
jgi:predicted transcriptional regulator